MDKIYSIVVTYNGAHWIRKCLASLTGSAVKTSIVVIDNKSTDDTVSIIRSEFPAVQLIAAPRNLGFGQANNIGLKIAYENQADYVLLLNQDAWIKPGTLDVLTTVCRQNPEYGIVSPVHLSGDGTALDEGFMAYASLQFGCHGFYSDLYLHKQKDMYSTQFVNAACWLISAACLKKVGGFDPLFFHYGEDENYIQRVRFHGFKIGICPKTEIYHDRAQFSGTARDLTLMTRENLIQLADVNAEDTNKLLAQEIMISRLKLLKLLFQLRFARFAENYHILKHLLGHRKKITASVVLNRQAGLHWLQ